MHPSVKGTGRHEFTCALVPHPGTWQEAASYRDAMELHVPLLAFSGELGLRRARPGKKLSAGELPSAARPSADQASLVEVTPSSVVLSSLRVVTPPPNLTTPEVELRLYETTGRAADVHIRLGLPIRSVQETNFLGRPTNELDEIEIRADGVHFRLPPWKIATLRIRR